MLYLISTALLEWPLYAEWSHRLQWSELIFGLAAVAAIWTFRKQGLRFSWTAMDGAVALYLAINWLSAILNYSQTAMLEVLGRSYLVGVYLLFRLGFLQSWINWQQIRAAISVLSLLIIVAIAIGYSLLALGRENILLVKYPDYPYFGTVYRAKFFLQTPSMYISMVNFCFLALCCDALCSGFSRRKVGLLLGLFVCALLSFSKAVLLLLLGAALAVFLFYRPRGYRLLAIAMSAATAVVYFWFTHFVFIADPAKAQIEQGHLAIKNLGVSHEAQWVPTAYFSEKKAAVSLLMEAPLLGIGPGGFFYAIDRMKAEGIYPNHLPPHDPHSSYFGALAETGILGLLSLLVLLGIAFWALMRRADLKDPMSLFLLVWIVTLLIEGFSGDLMNFRHYWVQFGLIGSYLGLAEKVETLTFFDRFGRNDNDSWCSRQ